jgi:hypothetical protein
MKDQFTLTGAPTFKLVSPDGTVKQEFTVPNLVVTSGKAYFASRAVGTSMAVM